MVNQIFSAYLLREEYNNFLLLRYLANKIKLISQSLYPKKLCS